MTHKTDMLTGQIMSATMAAKASILKEEEDIEKELSRLLSKARLHIQKHLEKTSNIEKARDKTQLTIPIAAYANMLRSVHHVQDRLVINTAPLTFQAKRDGNKYLLGELLIVIPLLRKNMNPNNILVLNKSFSVRSIHHGGNTSVPHGYTGRGTVCWGSASSDIQELFDTGNVEQLIITIVSALGYVNTRDLFGKNYRSWPVLTSKGAIRRTGKIVDAPLIPSNIGLQLPDDVIDPPGTTYMQINELAQIKKATPAAARVEATESTA
jgi:hypothetical protein